LKKSNNEIKEPTVSEVVIAITQQDKQLKAVMLQRKAGVFELVWTKSSELEQTSWRRFYQEIAEQIVDEENTAITTGFSSTGVIFYRIELPDVSNNELDTLVKLQAEARLPLPSEQMQVSWRTTKNENGQLDVTIAAARKEILADYASKVGIFKPTKIILNSEGIVETWKRVFSGETGSALILSVEEKDTQVCLAKNGYLSNAVSLDIGANDFSTAQTENAGRFAQDIKSILELFEFSEVNKVPIFVLSDGRAVIEEIVSCLRLAGLKAKAALPRVNKLVTHTALGIDSIYDYRVAIGLALRSFDETTEQLNLFEEIYKRSDGKRKSWWLLPRFASAIATAALLLFVIIFYLLDVATLNAIDSRLNGSAQGTNCNMLMEKQKLVKTVATQRIDLLRLLGEMKAEENNGVMLHHFDFKRGSPITIKGQAQNDDQMFKFQKTLTGKKGITGVRIQNSQENKKDKKVDFTITFHYKKFTKKKG